MSNGGWFGRDQGNSIEKGGYLPEATNRLRVFNSYGRTWFNWCWIHISPHILLILRIMYVGIKAKNPFNSMMAFRSWRYDYDPSFCQYWWNFWFNSINRSNFPFLSQGGNSLLVLSVAIGFVLNIDANEKREEIIREAREELQTNTTTELYDDKIIDIDKFY